jgi:pilus assembly protein CpaC
MVRFLGRLLTVLVGLLALANAAQASDLLERVKDQEIKQVLRLRVGHSKVLRTPFAITRISVAAPEIADIILISEKEVYVNAQAPGVTNLSLWGKGRFTTASVVVEADVSLLKEKLHQILPKEKIGVEAAGDSVVLNGEVSGPVAQDTALSLALPFVGGKKEKVVNLLHVGGVQQVMLEVRVAEIARAILDRIGVNFAIIDRSGSSFGVSALNSLTGLSDLVRTLSATNRAFTSFTQSPGSTITAIAGWKTGTVLWTMFFDLLKQNNLGRVLAEPNLVTTSGQEAAFLAGGEYPVPVPQASGGGTTITIEYKKFGVGLAFTPTVLSDQKIALKVAPEVSEIDQTLTVSYTAAGIVVPGLRVRRATTNVEVKDGQTLSIAGLLQDQDRNIVSKFPLLGDIPILGTLFRSSQWQRQKTELVVLVTPHLVKPMAATAVRLPTDAYVDPSDFEYYLLGWQEGKPKQSRPQPESKTLPPGFGSQTVE